MSVVSLSIRSVNIQVFVCFFLTRSSGPSGAAEGIGEDGWRGGAHSLGLGEYVHRNPEPAIAFTLAAFAQPVLSCPPPISSLAWMPTSRIAATRWGPKPCWTRRSTRSAWSTSCIYVRSLPSAGSWTCGASWTSLGAAWSNTLCC